MRLIGTLADEGNYNPLAFSYYLTSQGIDNNAEKRGSSYEIWIIDEDQMEKALLLFEEYKKDPNQSRYKKVIAPQSLQDAQELPSKRSPFSMASLGPLSIAILFVVITLFMWAQFARTTLLVPNIKGVVQAPLLAPIERALLYDYPSYFVLRDQLLTIWTPKAIENKEPPSQQAVALIHELQKKPVWMGFYNLIIDHKKGSSTLQDQAPLFEKISQGEYWRTITPAFLHYDLLHIFFNVLWFIILGGQIEKRVGSLRALILILVAALVSNTAQYLMSGPFFLGLSGVICAQAAFIWTRQQKAPWEGYLIHRATLLFLGAFVVGMFVLSMLLFFLQYYGDKEISIAIANTAHLAGALVGYLLGSTRLFASHL